MLLLYHLCSVSSNQFFRGHNQIRVVNDIKTNIKYYVMPAILSKPENPHKTWINKNLYGFVSTKVTLEMLKIFAKHVGLKVSGNKETLLNRCKTYQTQHVSARRIQSLFRGYYTRQWMRLKQGTKETPVNDTDFYTLDPIVSIPFNRYIHYTDPETNTNYVFDIVSLLNLLTSSPRFENPYTRKSMASYVDTIHKILRLTLLLYPQANTNNTYLSSTLTSIERARNLFIEIDLIGHYTSINWFLELTNAEIIWFYANFYNLWQHVPQKTIIPDGKLFENITFPDITATLEQNRTAILDLGEALVKTNGDRSLGAFYFLMALTTVSRGACNQYAFLYELFEALVN